MRITCIGGGPSGLYFALLMKKQNPAHEVTVLERNKAGSTFGWGVVFSDQTLAALREADPQTADEILNAFNHWDDIEVRIQGRLCSLKAEVVVLNGLSSHADHPGLLKSLGPLVTTAQKVRLVHGEPERAAALADGLRGIGFADVSAPERGESVTV